LSGWGIGELPKEVLIIVGVIPVMAITTVAALDEVPQDWDAHLHGRSRRG
jgi:ABC-type nitrate/sulfonate/bicarbonate transport system permease component